ncbi:MAG: flagellar filament capping protein FliD [Ignavibacteria bacterium]|nr:flagellar filament capping protein FliD [Ignavibacteria bacterium]
MADLTSSLDSLSNALSSLMQTSATSQSQAELLVEAYKRTQSGKLNQLKEKKTSLEKKSTFFSTLRSKINNLVSQIDKFTSTNASNLFITRRVISSDSSIVSATATGDALIGVNSVKVNRLASNDLLISAQLSASQNFAATGSNLTFKINGKDVTVSINPNTTNEDALKQIASAINNTSDINATASVIKDTNSTVRLTITAKNTGAENKITFDDNGSGVLVALGFNNVDPNSNVRTPVQSGNQYAHFKIADVSQLDSEAEINGITVIRSSNSLTDVIQGVTINLLKVQNSSDQPVTLTTEVDVSAVQSLLSPLLNAYNDVLQYLNNNKSLLRDEPLLRNLISNLRVISSQAVSTSASGNPQYLSEIGIKTNSDGTLSISNLTKLQEALVSDYKKVADLFTTSDSFVNKLNSVIGLLSGDTNYITNKTTLVQQQIFEMQKRISEFESKIDIQAENYKNEYFRSLEAYLKAQSQYTMFSNTASSLLNRYYY